MSTRGGPQGTGGSRRDRDALSTTQEVWDARGPHFNVAKVRLEVIDGSAIGANQVFEAERIVIGSHASADFVVRDATVSRLHCELVPDSGCVVIRDLESKNGTRIHGIVFKEATLTGTAILQLGHSKIRMVVDRDTASLPLFDGDRLGWLVGQSAAMRRVFAIIERAAASAETVLIQGEPGTGKAAVASTIHQLSARASQPLRVVDCSAIPRHRLEAELFGDDRGGAAAAHPGAFEAASGGSLLLDEIGELPIDLQPKLLGVLEHGEVRRIGGSQPIPVDVRVMAATSRSLAAQVNGHRFRSDLYYRIAAIRVSLPPLRSRFEDLPLLVADLASRLRMTAEDRGWLASPPLLSDLGAHHWPGNLRELQTYLEACVAAKTPDVIDAPEPAPAAERAAIDTTQPLHEARAAWMAVFDRAYATAMLREHGGNVSAAARASGADHLTFCRLLRLAGIK